MDIKVLGTGCPNCKALKTNVANALDSLGMEARVQEVTDFAEILSYGVSSTPALVLDGKVVTAGRVPPTDQIRTLLATAT